MAFSKLRVSMEENFCILPDIWARY